MSQMDKDILFTAWLGGMGLLVCLTGMGWALRGALALLPTRKEIA